MEEESYFYVVLEDDKHVNIMTTEGADEFLALEGGEKYLSSNLESASQLRTRIAQNAGVSNEERRHCQESLIKIYLMLGHVAGHASEEAFASVVDQEQLDVYISHAVGIFSDLALSMKWIKTGVLQKYDQELLDSLISHMKKPTFVDRVMKNDNLLLTTLAKLCAARQGTNMPCPDVTESLLSITNNYRFSLYYQQKLEHEVIFKQLESSGILAQAFRCITQPSTHGCCSLPSHLVMLDELLKCQAFVRKKLKVGHSTGDVLTQVVAGTNGFKGPRDEQVVVRLNTLAKMASLFNERMLHDDGKDMVGKACRNCNKSDLSEEFQSSLLACSRCKSTFYCSKACQTEDWKMHKSVCQDPNKALERETKGGPSTITSFITKNYEAIMKSVVLVTQKEGVDKQKVLLELDFFVTDGSAPALRDPPEFKVGVTKRYIQGKRRDEPDWFHKGTRTYKKNIKAFIVGMTDHYQRMTDTDLLTTVRYPGGTSGVYRVSLATPDTETPIFSNEAYNAFVRAFLYNDDSGLEQVFGERAAKFIEKRRNDVCKDILKRVEEAMTGIQDVTVTEEEDVVDECE